LGNKEAIQFCIRKHNLLIILLILIAGWAPMKENISLKAGKFIRKITDTGKFKYV